MPPTGSGPSSRIERSQILQAARRFYENGETQSAIAQDMGISASYLTRLLRRAKEAGWIRIFIDSDRETELAARVLAKCPHLVHVEVVPGGSTPGETARSIGTVAASWLNSLLDRDDERTDAPQISRIAIGGGAVHHHMIDQVARRQSRISVAPTAVSHPGTARVTRWTAPLQAARLALRLGALGAGTHTPTPGDRGCLYAPCLDPPRKSVKELRAWYKALRNRTDFLELTEFWDQVDIAFVSMVAAERAYVDVDKRLTELGVQRDDLVARGALALLANQFVDGNGNSVPIALGVPSYEPAISMKQLSDAVDRHVEKRPGFVVLDAWGELAAPAVSLVHSGVANVLFCDSLNAERLIAD